MYVGVGWYQRVPSLDVGSTECTLNQMKTVWQSKKSSKSVGSLFNQFNAFWALSYILINILALFLYMTTTNGFYKGGIFGHFIV